jgi:hypothetical protein
LNHRTRALSAHSKTGTQKTRRKSTFPWENKEGTDERQDENKEETTEDRTGTDRARRRETKADTENSGEINGRKSGTLRRTTTRKRQRDEEPKDIRKRVGRKPVSENNEDVKMGG